MAIKMRNDPWCNDAFPNCLTLRLLVSLLFREYHSNNQHASDLSHVSNAFFFFFLSISLPSRVINSKDNFPLLSEEAIAKTSVAEAGRHHCTIGVSPLSILGTTRKLADGFLVKSLKHFWCLYF